MNESRIDVRSDGAGGVIIALHGEIDVYNVGRFRERLQSAIGESVLRVTIDMTHLKFLDSIALGTLVGGQKRAQSADVPLVLLNPTPFMQRLLRTAGMNSVFDVLYSSENGNPSSTE